MYQGKYKDSEGSIRAILAIGRVEKVINERRVT